MRVRHVLIALRGREPLGIGESAAILPENSAPRTKGRGGLFCNVSVVSYRHRETRNGMRECDLVFSLGLEKLQEKWELAVYVPEQVQRPTSKKLSPTWKLERHSYVLDWKRSLPAL